MARGASPPLPIHLDQQSLAIGGGPTQVDCHLPDGLTTWSAAGSPYILPGTIPSDPSACAPFPAAADPEPLSPPGVVVGDKSRLVIDGSQGPVQIFSHGAGIYVAGGELQTIGTGADNSVTFDAEPDVASWDGIRIAADTNREGDASLSYVSIQHALTGINITSGATSSPDDNHYGLTVQNSGIVVSYFDGIDALNTPISITGRRDGRFGTLNNIGSFGIRASFDNRAPAIPAGGLALNVQKMTFGSSVPFAEKDCPPLQPCAAGTIGNDAIQATFVAGAAQPALISHNDLFRAGSYGVELIYPSDPIVQDNTFDCNGTGSPQPKVSCLSNVPNKFPPIYLNHATADLESKVTRNFGKEDGLEAIVFNGTVSSGTFTWKTATTNPTTPLGYMLDGPLNMSGGVFRVPGGSVIKASGGSLNLSGVSLDASDSGPKTFTSLRDSTAGVDAGCSVFVQVCSPPLPLPAGDWGGIKLLGSGANATIDHANIRYATAAITMANGAMSTPPAGAPTAISTPAADGSRFGLVVSNSVIGPTFADGIVAVDTPIALVDNAFTCPTTSCSGSSPIGNRGVDADYSGVGPLNGGLKLTGNHFDGSVNEAIRASALSGQTQGSVVLGPQPVYIRGNIIRNAGAFGINVQGAVRPTLRDNDVTGSGTGSVTYSAIYLNGLTAGDFNSPPSTPADPAVISGNTGSGNGLDAIVFHGTTAGTPTNPRPLNWQTVGASGLLGYVVDGDLDVNGPLTLGSGAYAPVLGGTITVSGGGLSANAALVTSLKQQTPGMPSCGSVFVPRLSGICPAPRAGDWGGFVLDPGQVNTLTASELRYPRTGITMNKPPATPALTNLLLAQTSISNTVADGITTQSPLSVTQGAFTNLGGRGLAIDLSAAGSGAELTIDRAVIYATGQEGIAATGLKDQTVSVSGVRVDQARAFGISLKDANHLTLTGNTVTNSAAGYPAIYLNGVDNADFNTAIAGNKGAGNGADALAFHGNVDGNLLWLGARKTADPSKLLGYILDGDLNMSGTLTVNAGDVVKISNGTINLNGGSLRAGDTGNSSQKVFTSLADGTAGVACPLALVPGCPNPAPGDWGGIDLANGAHATVVNAAVRYATTGIFISSRATSTYASSIFGLVVSGSSIGPSKVDGISTTNTPISVTTSTISGGVHGINVDYATAWPTTALRLSGDRITSTSAEAILGQALSGLPVWITDNHILNAGRFGIRLLKANALVLRNNNISSSGGSPAPQADRYPAIYLNAVSADFVRNIRGNVGSGNGLDALAMDGTVTSDLTWITPSNKPSTHALGYLLDGGLTLDGGNLTVGAGDVVKSLGGPITINGGSVNAIGSATPGTASTSSSAIFTSLKDNPNGSVYPVDVSDAAAVSCPSVLVSVCVPGPGDWGGLVITSNGAVKGSGAIEYGLINYANTGIALDSGPISASLESSNFRLTVANHTTITNTRGDGVNSHDTPFSVDSSTIENVGGNGIIASFFGPANCLSTPGTCVRLNVSNTHITSSGKDGVVANGLGEQPVTVTGNTVTSAAGYGILLTDADLLTLANNIVNLSGVAANAYPAIYLNKVIGDFDSAITGNKGAGNGLNALVFHGTVNTPLLSGNFTWLTPDTSGAVNPLGYMLDGALTVNGNFVSNNGVVKVLKGGIKVNGALTSTSTTFTSMQENVAPFACSTVFVPAVLSNPAPRCPMVPALWAGVNVDASASRFEGGAIRYSSPGLIVSGASLNVLGPTTISHVSGNAITVENAPATSKFEDLTLDTVNGNGVVLVNSEASFSRDTFTAVTGAGHFAIKSSGATTTIDCSSFHNNQNGVSFDGASSIAESDAYSNTTFDVVGSSGSPTATAVWWGAANTGGSVSGVSVSQLLASQSPVLSDPPTPGGSIKIDGTNPTATDTAALRALGIGTLTGTFTFSRQMDPSIDPLASFKTNTAGDPARTLLPLAGGGWNKRIWTSAPYTLDAAHATAGLNHLNVSGARSCVPDGPQDMVAPPSRDFYAAVLPTVVAVQAGATAPYGGSVSVQALLTSGGLPVANESASPIHFRILDASSQEFATGSTGTDAVGLATTASISIAGLNASPPSYGITAVFKGDNLYSVSNTDASQTLDVTKVATATSTVTSGSLVGLGTSVTDQASVTGVPATAGGTVTYRLFMDSANCLGLPESSSTTAAFSTGSIPGSSAWAAGPLGDYQWQATYSGDSNHQGSMSPCGSDAVTVVLATPTVGTVASSGVTVGSTISDTANVSGGLTPTGTVDFELYGPGDASCTTNLVASDSGFQGVSLTSGSATSPAYTTAQAGDYHWRAIYSGDSNNAMVTTGCGAEPVTVSKDTPTVGSAATAGGTVGDSISDTATVSGGFSPTGSVTFSLYGPGDSSCTTDLLTGDSSFHNLALTAGSVTTPSYTTSAVGTYNWVATHNGDANNTTVSTACGDETVTMAKASPTLTTAVDPASSVVTGTSVHDQATLTGGRLNAGGTVTYNLYTGSTCTGSPAFTSTKTVNAGAVPASGSTAPAAGTYTWKASYSGDVNNDPASSNCGDDLLDVQNILATISSLGPTSGPAAGNTTVTINGSHFAGATKVTFGATEGAIVSVADSQITATTAIESAGTVDVLITTPSGTSTAAPPDDQFTFVAYQATIVADAPSLFWRLGESSGTTAVASGSGNDGTYSAAGVTLGKAGALIGDSDKAVSLDGTAGAIQETSGGGVPVGPAARSLEIWFKTSTASSQPLFNSGSAGSLTQFSVYLVSDEIQVLDGADTLTYTASGSLSDGNWHHLVVTYDGSTSVRVYVDGTQAGSAQATSSALDTTLDSSGLELGEDNSGGFFNGTVDEVAIYSSALSLSKVETHFHAGRGD